MCRVAFQSWLPQDAAPFARAQGLLLHVMDLAVDVLPCGVFFVVCVVARHCAGLVISHKSGRDERLAFGIEVLSGIRKPLRGLAELAFLDEMRVFKQITP